MDDVAMSVHALRAAATYIWDKRQIQLNRGCMRKAAHAHRIQKSRPFEVGQCK